MLGASVIAALTMVSVAEADEDIYLQHIYENGEVIGCKDEASFNRLLSREQIETLAVDCKPKLVSGTLTFLGWTMFGSQFDGVVARKYVMETPEGTVRFAWPYPLEMSQYDVFSGPYEEEVPVPVLREPLPDSPVWVEQPTVVYAVAQ